MLTDSSCCQMRSTRHPRLLSVRTTRRSRALLRVSLSAQNASLFRGCVACFGQPCQKHPSTKSASRTFPKAKSGFPNRAAWRRQPTILLRRKIETKASSVALLPRPRTRDMISERFEREKMSMEPTSSLNSSYEPSRLSYHKNRGNRRTGTCAHRSDLVVARR